MEEGEIFGRNITLPSLPDLQSDCEAEILFLMKEVDLEFQRKNHSLLAELFNTRLLCQAQGDEIKSLKGALQSNKYEKENKILKEELSKAEERYQHLQTNYKKMTDVNDLSAASFKEAKVTEKIVSDENTFCHDFLLKLDRKIQDLVKENTY